MLVPELKSSQRHPPSPKELGETEVKSNKKNKGRTRSSSGAGNVFYNHSWLSGCRGVVQVFGSGTSGRGDGGAGGAKAPPLFAKMKFAYLYFTVLR